MMATSPSREQLYIFIWLVLLPLLNFVFWYYLGRSSSNSNNAVICDSMEQLLQDSLNELHYEQECEKKQSLQCSPRVSSSSSDEMRPTLGGHVCIQLAS